MHDTTEAVLILLSGRSLQRTKYVEALHWCLKEKCEQEKEKKELTTASQPDENTNTFLSALISKVINLRIIQGTSLVQKLQNFIASMLCSTIFWLNLRH